MPTLNGLSDRSASVRPRLPPHGLHSESLTRGPPSTPTPRPGLAGSLLTAFLRLARQNRLGTIRLGTPARKEPEGVWRKARHGSQVNTTILGTIPYMKQCSAATLTQSIVGAARNSHMVSPRMSLDIDRGMGSRIYHTR